MHDGEHVAMAVSFVVLDFAGGPSGLNMSFQYYCYGVRVGVSPGSLATQHTPNTGKSSVVAVCLWLCFVCGCVVVVVCLWLRKDKGRTKEGQEERTEGGGEGRREGRREGEDYLQHSNNPLLISGALLIPQLQ